MKNEEIRVRYMYRSGKQGDHAVVWQMKGLIGFASQIRDAGTIGCRGRKSGPEPILSYSQRMAVRDDGFLGSRIRAVVDCHCDYEYSTTNPLP